MPNSSDMNLLDLEPQENAVLNRPSSEGSSSSYEEIMIEDHQSQSSTATTSSASTPASSSISTVIGQNKRSLDNSADPQTEGGSPRIRILEDSSNPPTKSETSSQPGEVDGDIPGQLHYPRSIPIRLPSATDYYTMDVDTESASDAAGWELISNNSDSLARTIYSGDDIPATKPPTIQEQIKIIENASNVSTEEGQTWYIISESWWNKFISSGDYVAPLDNSDILDIRRHLQLDADYKIISKQSWDLIVKWYGEADDEPQEIPRIAVNTSRFNKNIEVEVYPPEFLLHHLSPASMTSAESFTPSVTLSRTSTLTDLFTSAKELLDIRPSRLIRIWKLGITPIAKLDVEAFKLISEKEIIDTTDMDALLGDIGLGMNLALVVEENFGNWISERPTRSSAAMAAAAAAVGRGARNSNHSKDLNRRNHDTRNKRNKGTTGLSNLGNTCYMNSALQCLTHVEELTKYFLLDAYKDELNPSNPLGMDGKVAISYGQLIHTLFGSESTLASFSPRDIKSVIGRYGPMFSGYGQHDSQEFLAFLLDGLHEDLNRILSKPYTEKPELADDEVDNKEAVQDLAQKCWDLHRLRNDSVIQDLFTGMYKSTLVCPVCNKVSITFDPFMDLTLPFPIDNSFSADIIYIPIKGRPYKIAIEMDGTSSIKDYKTYMAQTVGTEPTRLLSASIYNSRLVEVHNDHDPAGSKLSGDSVLYELEFVPNDPDFKDIMIIPVVSRLERQPESRYGSAELFGYPFLLTLSATNASNYDYIYSKIVEKYKGMSRSKVLQNWGFGDDAGDGIDSSSDNISKIGNFTHPDIFNIFVTVHLYSKKYSTIPTMISNYNSTTSFRDRFAIARPESDAEIEPISNSIQNDDGANPDSEGIDGQTIAVQDSLSQESNEDGHLIDEEEVDRDAHHEWIDNGNTPSDVDMLDASDNETESTPRLMKDNDSDTSDGMPPLNSLFDSVSQNEHASSDQMLSGPIWDPPTEEESQESVPISMGEVLICEWTKENYDLCFGGADNEDEDQSSPVWTEMTYLIPEDVAERRRKKELKKGQQITLDDCLDLFSKPEVLGEDDLWYCPRCKEHRQAVKTIELWKAPEIFAVHLKRFSSTSRRDKIDALVDFPVEALDMSKRVGDSSQDQGADHLLYDLFGVDNHFGGLGGGHYTANVKNFVDGKWYYFDDSSVRETTPESGVTSAAYLLFYRRRSATTLGGEKLADLLSGNDPFAPEPTDSTSISAADIITSPPLNLPPRLITDYEGSSSDSEVGGEGPSFDLDIPPALPVRLSAGMDPITEDDDLPPYSTINQLSVSSDSPTWPSESVGRSHLGETKHDFNSFEGDQSDTEVENDVGDNDAKSLSSNISNMHDHISRTDLTSELGQDVTVDVIKPTGYEFVDSEGDDDNSVVDICVDSS
ncbi:uncharacterized protein V1516DRAFT_668393 [Lipomyces oligophaga]|uniref:uncharacterized protein n=1 Tax=Lipomyces oligophaga TaxID=45792 RepID=UPI0034CFA61A